jgi:hypothetical protein
MKNRLIRDRRLISRVPARLGCRFTYQGIGRDAVIIDLSLNGAYLASKFLPPTGGDVSIALTTQASKCALTLEGKVVRGGESVSDHGTLSRFAVRFDRTSLELIKLINQLAAN